MKDKIETDEVVAFHDEINIEVSVVVDDTMKFRKFVRINEVRFDLVVDA